MGRIAVYLLIFWMLEVFLVGAFVQESWFKARIQTETDTAVAWLGGDTVKAVYRAADRIFESTFVETGIYDTSYELFIPSDAERRRSRGMENMGKEIFEAVDKRLEVMWMAVYQVVVRVLMLFLWVPYFLIVLIPAVVDGYMIREIKKTNYGFSSPAIHRYSIYLMGLVTYGIVLTLFSPVNVNPVVYPAAIMIIVTSIHFIVSNTQKRI